MGADDPKGMKVVPGHMPGETAGKGKMLVVTECYCPSGHSLLYSRASFNGYPGILIKVTGDKGTGHIVLSPISGDKSHVALDLDLVEGEIMITSCPACGVVFERLGPCPCGGDIITLHTTAVPDSDSCIGICNRVGCVHSEVRSKGDLILLSMMDDLKDR